MSLIILFSIILNVNDTIKVHTVKSKTNIYSKEIVNIIVNRTNAKLKTDYKLKFIEVDEFSELFTVMKKTDNFSCAVSAITITKERSKKFDFSYPYFPIKEAILTSRNKKFKPDDWKRTGTKIALVKGSIGESHISTFKEKYKLKTVLVDYKRYQNLQYEIETGKIDFFVSDIVESWTNKNIQFVSDFKEAKLSYYGFMYPKDSKLKKIFDPAIISFIRTPSYLRLLKKNYGQKIVDYYREVSTHLENYKSEL